MAESIWTHKKFEGLFRKNYHVACLIALRYVDNVDDAEDLVQEVFIELWEKRRILTINTNFKNYLYTSVKNRAINLVKRKRIEKISISNLFFEIKEEDDVDYYKEEELAVKLAQAIKELPPRCRKIFSLAYFDGCTYQQIAKKLNVSKNTVKTQMKIAFSQLRVKFKRICAVLFKLFYK